MVGYKISVENRIPFPYTSSENSENALKKTIPFTVESKNNKITKQAQKSVYVKLQTIAERN